MLGRDEVAKLLAAGEDDFEFARVQRLRQCGHTPEMSKGDVFSEKENLGPMRRGRVQE